MPKIRQVPGIGRVRFPDSMSDADIDATIENRVWEKRPPVQASLNIQPPFNLGTEGISPAALSTIKTQEDAERFAAGDEPFASAGAALTKAGKASVAGLADLWTGIREQMNPMGLPTPTGPVPTSEMQERQLERDLPGYIKPPSNLEAVGLGEPMPAEYQSQFLPPLQRGMLRGTQGFVESTPRLAAMSAMTGGAGVPAWLAGGLTFGATEEGLDPKAVAIGAALPVAGHGLAELSKLAALRMGITQPEALNWIKGITATVGPAGGLYAEQLYTINQMEKEGLIDKQDADDQRMTALFSMGYNLGQGPMGVKWESTRRPPIIPQRRTQNMLRELPGAEHLNELERAYVDAEREMIDTPMRVVKEVDLTNTDDPFARSKKREKTGIPMRMNKDTGEIEIYPGELSDYLSTISEGRRGLAMRGRFDEEEIHDNTEPLDAAEFYQGSSPLSRAIFNRVYIGNGEGRDPITGQKLSDAELGYEMVRIRMQQLGRDGPVEIAEAALRERWTLRSLLALEAIVRKAEEATMAGSKRNAARQMEILQNVKDNLAVAKRTIETGQPAPRPTRISPAARRKQRLPYDERTRKYFAMMRQATDDPDTAKQAEQEIAQRDRESEPPTPIGEANLRETFHTKPGQQEMDLGPTERTTDASQDPQAAEIYGDLRAQPSAGEAQVPAQEGGPGVQSYGEVGPAARRKQMELGLDIPPERDLSAERDYYRYMDLKRFGNTERFDPDTEQTFTLDQNDVRARMEAIEKKYGGPPPEPVIEPTPGSVQGAIRYGPADDRRIIDAVAAGKKPFGELTVAVDSPEHKRVKRLVEAGKIDAKMHEFDGSWSPYGPSEKLVAIGMSPKGALEHMIRQREDAVTWSDYGELYGFTKQEISDFEYRSEHGDFPAARMKRRKAAQVAMELIHGDISSEGIEAKVANITGVSVDDVKNIRNFLLKRGGERGMQLLAESFIRRGWSDRELDLSPGARRKFNHEAKTEKEIVDELGRGLIDLLMSGLVGDKKGIGDTIEGLGEFVKVLKGKIDSGEFKDLNLQKLNSAISDVERAISQFPMMPVGGKETAEAPKFDTKLLEPTETIQGTEDRVKHILGLVGELWNMGNHAESIEMSQALKKFIDDSANRFQDKIELEVGHSPDTARRTQAFIDHLRMVSGRVERQIEADVRDQQTSFPAGRRKKNLPEVQGGLDFEGPTSMTPKADKGPVEGATGPKYAPISPNILEESVGKHILENPDPSFNSFAKMASDKWGVQPGQLRDVWRGQMWNTLMKATGRQLTELVFRLDLGSKLKLRKNLEKMAQARATESGEAVRTAPSISSGENLVIANKMYGQIPDAPEDIAIQTQLQKQLEAGELDLGVAGMKKIRSTLKDAERRAATAKAREAEYNKWFDQAKELRSSLRNAGFTNIDDVGNPIGGPAPNAGAKATGRRLLHARIQMDKLADPDYFSRPEDRELVSKRKVRQNIYPTDPVTGQQTSIHPIGTKVFTKLVSQGKAKVPEYESMARPGFSPGLPPRKGSAQTRAAQERRLRAISAIGERLLEQQESKQEKLMRREVTPDDIAYYRGPEAIRQLTPEEQKDVGTVSSIIGAAPAPDRATVTEKVIGGVKTAVRRERNTEAATRNLVAVEEAHTGRVYLVSTYMGGDGVVRVLNPSSMHLQRKHEALSPRFLRQYKPLWSLQIDEPVRDFIQKFKDKDQFRREFISEAKGRFAEMEAERDVMKLATPDDVSAAREKLAARMALGVTDPEQFKTLDQQLRQRAHELESAVSQKSGMYGEGRLVSESLGNPNVTVQEAGAIWQALKLWQRKDPASVIAEFQRMQREAPKRSEFETQAEQQERSQSRLALIGLNKMLKQTEARGMGIAYLMQNISRLSEGRQQFIRNILTQYAKPEPPHELGTGRRPIGAAPEPSPTDVTIPSKGELAQRNYLREQIGLRPVGPQRDPAIHVPETYRRPEQKMMTPEEAEFVRQQRVTQGEARPGIDTPTQTVGQYPPAARNKMVQAGMNAVRDVMLDPTGGFLRYYSGWMSQRLREGGGKVANSTADIFDQIIDREKQLMGSLTKHLDPALKEVGKPRLGTWLNGYDVIGGLAPNAAIGRSQGAIEGWLALPGSKLVGKGKNAQFTPSWADKGVQLARAANYAAGRMIAAVTPGFQPSGKFERHLTSVGYDIIRTGSGPLYEAWLDGMAEANTPHTYARNTKQGMRDFLQTRKDAHDMFQRMKKILDDPTPDMVELDKVNQDFRRIFPKAVTHVRAPGRGIFGGWKEVLHSNMFNYLNATAKRASHVRSFREQFPNSVVGRSAFKKMREDIATEFDPNFRPGDKNLDAILGNFDALTRALQGHSTDQYGHNRNWMHEVGRPGTFTGDFARFTNNTMMNLMAKLVLSKQLITQTGELAAGSTPQYLGYGNYARAARMMGADALRKQSFFDLLGNPRKFLKDLTSAGQAYQQMEQQGMVNRVMYDWAFDPKAPITSGSKIVGNVISKVFMENLLNETQEAMAAATAKVTAERIVSGNLSKWEQRHLPATFKAMGFQPGEVNAMMQGDPGMLDMFQRRAAAFLTGGNKHAAESSRIGANRLFNSIFRFQSYPMMKSNQLRQDIINKINAKTDGARAVANQKLARNLFFNAAQGAITTGVAAAMGGATSAGIKGNEVKDQPFRSLLEFYFAANSGPLYLLWRNAGDAGMVGATEQVGRMMFPYSMANEFMDLANGVGAYRDQSLIEKVGTFARKKTPGLAAAKSGMSYFGLGVDSTDMNAARDAFYRWQRSEGIGGGRPGRPENEAEEKFRLNMRRATQAIIAGNEEKYLNAAYEAVGAKNSEDAAASLRGKRLLTELSLEQKSKLMDRIGLKAYNILEGHDAMLGAAAERLNPTD